MNKISFFILPLFLVLAACSKEKSLPDKARGTLIESSQGGMLSKSEVVERVDELSAQDIVKYDVSYHYITYRTDFQGKAIDSKGLLLLPENADSVPLIAYFHGTQIPLKMAGIERQTPSFFKGEKADFQEVRNMGLVWASAGYAVFIPDYIGYGMTIAKEHPYVYYPEMFKSNVDGLLAVKQLLVEKGFPEDKRVFLTGWSQGAGASLSAHRYIQEGYSDKFTVVASSGLAGPYNFTKFLNDVFKNGDKEVPVIAIASWAIYAANKFSDVKRPVDQIWSYPVYDQISALNTPSTIPDKVFNNYFLSRILNGSDVAMTNLIKKNSFHEGWLPVGKVFLHHGDADNVVPYFNSVDAYAGLTSAGGDVTFYTYPGGKHDTELENFILKTLNDFNSLL